MKRNKHCNVHITCSEIILFAVALSGLISASLLTFKSSFPYQFKKISTSFCFTMRLHVGFAEAMLSIFKHDEKGGTRRGGSRRKWQMGKTGAKITPAISIMSTNSSSCWSPPHSTSPPWKKYLKFARY